MKPRKRPDRQAGPYVATLSRLASWLASRRRDIRAQIVVHKGRRAGEGRTRIEVDHLLQTGDVGFGLLRVHAGKTFLPRAHFSSEAKMRISNAARSNSGRALYCIDMKMGEVVAVIAFHLPRDPRHPLLLTCIAFRDDVERNPALEARSIAAGLILKHYVHAASHHLGRGGHIDIDLPDPAQLALLRELGFNKAPKVDGFRPSGTHLRQAAPVSRPRVRGRGRR
ncbi:MAG: hypothetical protein U0R71_03685 [Solirubrobacterales bacterium]